ncbi:MAG: hypothetical protein QXT64_08070, partial [Desulfurococcaceae archaeon]
MSEEIERKEEEWWMLVVLAIFGLLLFFLLKRREEAPRGETYSGSESVRAIYSENVNIVSGTLYGGSDNTTA